MGRHSLNLSYTHPKIRQPGATYVLANVLCELKIVFLRLQSARRKMNLRVFVSLFLIVHPCHAPTSVPSSVLDSLVHTSKTTRTNIDFSMQKIIPAYTHKAVNSIQKGMFSMRSRYGLVPCGATLKRSCPTVILACTPLVGAFAIFGEIHCLGRVDSYAEDFLLTVIPAVFLEAYS